MKLLTRTGEIELSAADLARYDRGARREITKAKRAGQIRVEGNVVDLTLRVQGTLSHDMQSLLRHLVNLRNHGKAYASEESGGRYGEVHHRIGISRSFLLRVKFDLDTGEMLVNFDH